MLKWTKNVYFTESMTEIKKLNAWEKSAKCIYWEQYLNADVQLPIHNTVILLFQWRGKYEQKM